MSDNIYIHPKQVCEIAGISYRQLQYWDLKGFVSPKRSDDGALERRLVSLYDVACYVAMANLRKLGYSIQQITKDFLPWVKKYIGESCRGSGWNMYISTKTDSLFCVIGFLDTNSKVELFLSDQDVRDKVASVMCDRASDTAEAASTTINPPVDVTPSGETSTGEIIEPSQV
jgi:hypothetical protein